MKDNRLYQTCKTFAEKVPAAPTKCTFQDVELSKLGEYIQELEERVEYLDGELDRALRK